jgi:hypothetical protein
MKPYIIGALVGAAATLLIEFVLIAYAAGWFWLL